MKKCFCKTHITFSNKTGLDQKPTSKRKQAYVKEAHVINPESHLYTILSFGTFLGGHFKKEKKRKPNVGPVKSK